MSSEYVEFLQCVNTYADKYLLHYLYTWERPWSLHRTPFNCYQHCVQNGHGLGRWVKRVDMTVLAGVDKRRIAGEYDRQVTVCKDLT